MVSHIERPEPFWPLWRKHSPRLFAICLREMNCNWADAEDAVGEAMLRAHNHLPTRLDNTEAWLTRVTINVCRDLQRARARTDAVKAQYARLRPVEAAHAEWAEEEECDPHLMLERLPKRLREALTLRAVQKASYDDIAARLGISPANVRKRVQQARVILRALRSGGAPGAAETNSSKREIDAYTAAPGRAEKKIASLRAHVARHPAGWKMRLCLADLLYVAGVLDDAVECYRAVLERRPYLQEVRSKLDAIASAKNS